jgi:hypothetical protein
MRLGAVALVGSFILGLPMSALGAPPPPNTTGAGGQDEGVVEGPATDEDAVFGITAGRADDPGRRPWFIYTLPTSGSVNDVVTISNFTEQEMEFDLYPADAFSTVGSGAFAVERADDTVDGVGGWIELPVDHLVVPPRSAIEVPFLLTVPDDANPGDQAGAIVAANVSPVSDLETSGTQLEILGRVASRVYVRVDGPLRPALTIESMELVTETPAFAPIGGSGSAKVAITVRNTGNVRLSTTTAVKMTGLFGRTIDVYPDTQVPDLLPGASIEVVQFSDSIGSLDHVRAEVVVTADDIIIERDTAAWSIPWGSVVALTLLLAVAILLFLRRRRRRRRRRQPPAGGQAQVEPAPALQS